ncbi:ABC transporter permease [Paenibacillus baekrokdamisoli]|uniref:ABC transporter permease n=1 Tax=Paenibacillus baekrokdamisoli TaxID=1712516 RepID=A0A3G9JF06_9BACL|nr:sugar ABC transporter permease [Paenibacillus baekrokdamisoli]MBB3071121.1 raffinose/stachyose/melibiose transport system permease protein [Paenibacillus baekrokdamisoli]BBH21539.1 ABC transporter permease [Paenibacillus baekrokdamisoli]
MSTTQKKLYSYYFILPAAVLYIVLFIVPTFSSFYFSLTRWTLFDFEFIGLDNFVQLFKEESLAIGFKNTVIYTVVSVFFKVVLGLGLAMLLNKGLKTQSFLRAVFFFPSIISSVAIGLIFNALMYPTTGLINNTLRAIGLDGLARNWLTDPSIVIYSVSFVEVWKYLGICIVIFIAGLQAIPKHYYEAISIDGANRFEKFRYITLPLIRPALNSVIILSLIGGIRSFEIVYVMTQGGPGYASDLLSTVIYKQFAEGYYGLATAGNVLLFAAATLIVFPLYTYLTKREVEY